MKVPDAKLSLAALLLVGCTSDVDDNDHGGGSVPVCPMPQSRVDARTLEEPMLATSVGETLGWDACAQGFECAKILVPLDYENSAAGSIELFVMRRRARSPSIGTLFINPGGPGASAVERLANFDVPSSLKKFDIVAFDPRGVGRSTPLDCHSTLQAQQSLDSSPDDEGEWTAIEQAAIRFSEECKVKHGDLLPHLSTPNVARDMDRVRAALGIEKLNFLGWSYGTAIGAWYAELFPDRVRAMVLDGAVNPALSAVERNLAKGKAAETALQRYFAWCSKSTTNCRWTRGKQPAEAFALLAADIEGQSLDAHCGDRPAGPSDLLSGTYFALNYGAEGWPWLSAALDWAAVGDGSALVRFTDVANDRRDDGTYRNSNETFYAVYCLDYPVPDVSTLRSESSRFREASPTFGEYLLSGLMPCATWGASLPKPNLVHGDGLPPILVIGTTGDPVTPYAWAEALSKQLTSSVLLTHESGRHCAYGGGSTCVDDAVERYLITGLPPANRTRCAPDSQSVSPLKLTSELALSIPGSSIVSTRVTIDKP